MWNKKRPDDRGGSPRHVKLTAFSVYSKLELFNKRTDWWFSNPKQLWLTLFAKWQEDEDLSPSKRQDSTSETIKGIRLQLWTYLVPQMVGTQKSPHALQINWQICVHFQANSDTTSEGRGNILKAAPVKGFSPGVTHHSPTRTSTDYNPGFETT